MKEIVTLDDIEAQEWSGQEAGHHNGRIWWIFTPENAATEGLKMHVQEYDAGGYTDPDEHPTHMHIEQVYYVMSGTMGLRLNGQDHLVKAGSYVFIPRGADHGHWNAGEDKLLFLTVNSPVRSGEVPPLPRQR